MSLSGQTAATYEEKKKGTGSDLQSLAEYLGYDYVLCRTQARSKRSAFMTLFHAAAKSVTNFCSESAQA